jgi:hypothetical protein
MSELTDVFEEMLDSAEEVKGQRETIHFRGEDLDALFGEQNVDLIPGSGGNSDKTPIKVSCRLSDIDPVPEPLEPVVVRGRDLAVLTYDPLEGRIDLICGDPSVELND